MTVAYRLLSMTDTVVCAALPCTTTLLLLPPCLCVCVTCALSHAAVACLMLAAGQQPGHGAALQLPRHQYREDASTSEPTTADMLFAVQQ